MVERPYRRGIELARRGDYFAAHEAFEEAWRAAEAGERDFFQGLVHVVVAWHHTHVTGRPRARASQLEKAARRLAPFAPAHRALDVAALLADVAAARGGDEGLSPRFRAPRRAGSPPR
ncbi:MAG: DUF309 domain-containing protein [Thermoleophilia bacterium]|nr:DUF309 domain-containing protein [Thermoleophilia bacterium]